MVHTEANPSFAARVESRAQSLFIALLVAFSLLTFGQLLSINRELGALSANVATLTELARDHTAQLRELDHRMTSIETRMTSIETRMTSIESALKALTEAVNRIAPK
jgi:chromosome segregation ATPase